MKTCPYCWEKIQDLAKKCRFCWEFLEEENKREEKDNKVEKWINKFWTKLRRFFIVLYFIITIPIAIVICYFQLIWHKTRSILWGGTRHINYYYWILFCLITIVSYIIITDLLRRLANFIWHGTFNGIIDYNKLFTKYVYLPIVLVIISVILFFLWKNYLNYSEEEIFTWIDEKRMELLNEYAEWLEGKARLNKMWDYYEDMMDFKDQYWSFYIKPHWSNDEKPEVEEITIWNMTIKEPKSMWMIDKLNEFKLEKNKNLYVKKTNLDEITSECVRTAWWWLEEEWITIDEEGNTKKDYENEEKNMYKKYFTDIINGNFKQWKYGWTFNLFSCWYTQWSVYEKSINIDWVNWVILYMSPTQDEDCLSMMFQEIFLVKSLDEIYDIKINYNFWLYFDELVEYWLKSWWLKKKWDYYDWSVCTDSMKGSWITERDIIRYLKSENKDDYDLNSWFTINEQIIEDIIDSISIK